MERSAAEEQEALRGKYKKSLQELMHILKVNKSLKDCLDAHARNTEHLLAQQQADHQATHQRQLDAYQRELTHYQDLLTEETLRSKRLEDALLQNNAQLQATRDQQGTEPTGKEQRGEAESLRAALLEATRERDQLSVQVGQLRSRVGVLQLQLVQERERCRSQLFSRETELLRSRESEHEKLRTIESKYVLLESELSNYRSVEKYFEEEADSLLQDDALYNSIRQQISRINQDFNKYELESSQLLLRKREQDAERNQRIAQLEDQLTRMQDVEQRLAERETQAQAERAQTQALRLRVRQLEGERDQAIQKSHVLEALTITESHRSQTGISERIREFDTRVRLLLEGQGNTQQGAGVQGVVALKGYVEELSELLRQSRRREERLSKKVERCKEKLQGTEEAYRAKVAEFKGRIGDYEVLVGKLYAALEERTRTAGEAAAEREFSVAIAHYEQKMVEMSEEILRLRGCAEAAVEEGRVRGREEERTEAEKQLAAAEGENQTYKEIISELSVKLNDLAAQAQRHDQHTRDKDRLVTELANEVAELNVAVEEARVREEAATQALQGSERRAARFRQELEEKERISTNLSRNSIDTASLIEKVNYLEFELARARKADPTPHPDDFVKGLEGTLNAQNQQLAQHKAEIDRLYAQLKTEKAERQASAAEQLAQVGQLQREAGEWELRALGLQEELHSREAQAKDELEGLRFQNRKLIEQLNSKHDQMMGYYEELARRDHLSETAARVPELQACLQELERKNHEIIERVSHETNELNAAILALRTSNLTLRNDLENKEDAINDLKHQLFNAELSRQKDRPISASMVALSRDASREAREEGERERLLVAVVLLGAETEALRGKNEELEAMYHEDLDKYREALKQLEARQMELCNSLQLSSEAHEQRDSKLDSHLHLSQENISHLSQNSTALLAEPTFPDPAFRSQQQCPEPQTGSNVSIEAAPLKRKGLTIRKIA